MQQAIDISEFGTSYNTKFTLKYNFRNVMHCYRDLSIMFVTLNKAEFYKRRKMTTEYTSRVLQLSKF